MQIRPYVADDAEDLIEAPALTSVDAGLYTHPTGRKFYVVAADTDVVIVLADGQAPRASNRWTKSNMLDAVNDGYFNLDESDGLVVAN